MTNLEMMKAELNKSVIAPLLGHGFVGSWPHYRRIHTDYIELLTFQINKHGGCFTIELSAIFPGRSKMNYTERDNLPLDKINVWDTDSRYRLKGMYGGWFYYRDLYKKYIPFFGTDYLDIPEKEADSFIPPKDYRLVQTFNTDSARLVCFHVNRQLKKGFRWLKRFIKRNLQQA